MPDSVAPDVSRPPLASPAPAHAPAVPGGLRSAVCTLADGDFHFGAAALANSLIRHGYQGSLWIGHRGALPPWAGAARADGAGLHRLDVTDAVSLRFFQLEAEGLFAFQKGRALVRVLDELAPDADALFFFDADIVVKNEWAVFEELAGFGVGAVLDISDTYMLPTHPKKLRWARMLEKHGLPVREVHGYYNSGFLALPRHCGRLLEVWMRLVAALPDEGRPFHVRRYKTRASAFHFMDQDMFNAALMGCDVPLVSVGPDGMDAVFPYGFYMSHAYWRKKPWARRYLRDALRGLPPDKAHQIFWRYLDGPIKPFTDAEYRRRVRAVRIAKLIGRFYRRPEVDD